MKIKAAQQIQAYFRARLADKELKPKVIEKRDAAKTVFRMWRTYEERKKLMEWLIQNCSAAKARADELASMTPEERKAREEKRKAERMAKAKAAAEAAAADQANKSASANEAEAAAAAAREAAMASQNANQISMEDADKIKRQADAERAEKLRLAKEKAQRDKENSELWKLLHPVDDDDMYEDEEGNKHVRHVIDFKKEGSHGHMFTVYHPRKNRTPHERFVKISFKDGEPQDISWGSGADRMIKWSDIKFVIKGKKTTTMLVWKDMADDEHTFSVITPEKTLDCSASDDHSRDIWADGITKLLGQSEADRQAAQDAYDPNTEVTDVEKPREKTQSQLQTQRNLFAMIVKTTFREINYEGLYGFVGEPVQAEFKSDVFYQKALASGVPWREWDDWVRADIVNYLVQNGLVDPDTAQAHEAEMKANPKQIPDVEPAGSDCMIG